MGSFMVLPMHAALISALTAGTIIYTQEGKQTEVTVTGGFVEVNQNVISACVEL